MYIYIYTYKYSYTYQDTTNNRLLIHGGNLQGSDADDLWAYDFANNSWTELTPTGTKPSGRTGHVAAVDTSSGKLLIHAGNGDLDDLWAYDFAGNSWTELTPSGSKPAARADHVAAMDTSSGKLLIHGGFKGKDNLDDLWAYDLASNSWTELTPSGSKPAARNKHVAAVDTSSGRLLIHGGSQIFATLDDLWAYDLAGNSWTELTPSGAKPAGRNDHAVAMDASSSRLLIHGGRLGSSGSFARLNDFWAYDFDNSSWADLTPSGTKPSVSSHVAALADGSRFLTFGGSTSGGRSDAMWQFAWVTSTSTSTSTSTATITTITSTTAAPAIANTTTTATVTATFSLAGQIGAAAAICRPSAPALFYALLCVAGLAIM